MGVLQKRKKTDADVARDQERKEAPIRAYNSWFEAFMDPRGIWRTYRQFTQDTLVSKWGLFWPVLFGLFPVGPFLGLVVLWLGAKVLVEWAVNQVGGLVVAGFDFAVPRSVDESWAILAFFAGMVLGVWLLASFYIYRKSHMLTHVFEFEDVEQDWHPTSLLILPMPRENFWRRPEAIFGPPNRAGVMNGQAYLGLKPGLSIHSLKAREAIAALAPRIPSCTEHNPKHAAQLLEMGKAMGRAIFDDVKRSWQSILKSNVGFIYGAAMSIGAVIVLNMGESGPPVVPDDGTPGPTPGPDGEFGGTSGLRFVVPLARAALSGYGLPVF